MESVDKTNEVAVFKTNDGKAFPTTDGFDNFVSRLGLNNQNTLSAGMYTFNLVTRNRIQLEAAYRGSWLVGQVVDAIAEDMTRAGIDIDTTEDEKDIKKIKSAMVKLKIWSSLCDEIKWARLYGGALGVLQIEGQNLETPLDIKTVTKGQFKGISVYDRWQLNPVLERPISSGPDIGLPSFYDITTGWQSAEEDAPTATGQIRVHHSRCIRLIGIQLPFFQAITEMMWGESELERMWDRMISFDDTSMNAANLVERANNRTVGVENLREIIAAGGKAQQGLEAMFEMMRQFQTNEGMTLLDKNDEFQTSNYTFTGLSDVLLQFGMQVSGASGIPLVRLFGQSPAGLSATGESDLRNYYDKINAKQEASLRDAIDIVLRIMWRSVLGKDAPEDLEFTFASLWQTSALDKTTIAKSAAETVSGLVSDGIIPISTAMKELRQAAQDTGMFSNITDEQIKDAENSEAEGPPEPDDLLNPADPEAAKPGLELVPPLGKTGDQASVIARIKAWVGR